MNKGALVGGALGVVVLAFLGGYWASNSSHSGGQPTAGASSASGAASASATGATSSSGGLSSSGDGAGTSGPVPSAPWLNPSGVAAGNAPASGASPGAAPGATPLGDRLPRDERRKVREEIRKKLAALQAKGPNATIAETQALMDEVEVLGRGMFDPRYFQTMRQMLQQSAQVQALSKELRPIANSTAPKDVARRQEILAEMRNLSDQISQGSVALQTYANAVVSKQGKTP